MLKTETSANTSTQLDYRFTGIPGISSDHYVLRRDGEEFETFSSGGTISWSHEDWEENHNFTLSYQKIPETDEDSNGGSGGGIAVGGNLSTSDRLSDSNSWSSVNRNQFRFNSVKEDVGLKSVTVEPNRTVPASTSKSRSSEKYLTVLN